MLACLGTGPGLFTSLLLSAAIFFSGTQLVCMGIMGEYLGRIYRGGKQRPLYLVRERLGEPAAGLQVVPAERQEAA